MEVLNLFVRSIKWRFQNPITIVMSLVQPLIWLLLFSGLFGSTIANAQNYTAFVLPGILVMCILAGSGISGIANYSLKQNGSFYRIIISPVHRKSIVLAHILDSMVLSVIQITVLFLIAILMSVRIASGIPGFIFLLFLLLATIFFVASISYAMSMKVPDENAFIAMVNTLTLPLFFISTALLNLEQAPSIFKIPITINPFTYVINALRGLILDATIELPAYCLAVALMLLLGIISFTGAVHGLKKSQE